jgi:hypothetical protein
MILPNSGGCAVSLILEVIACRKFAASFRLVFMVHDAVFVPGEMSPPRLPSDPK